MDERSQNHTYLSWQKNTPRAFQKNETALDLAWALFYG